MKQERTIDKFSNSVKSGSLYSLFFDGKITGSQMNRQSLLMMIFGCRSEAIEQPLPKDY
jgi:hypothetical protein